MTATSLLRTSGRRAVLLLVCVLLGAGIVLVISLLEHKEYTATRQEFVGFNGANSPNQLQQGAAYTTGQMQSFGQLVTSARVLQPVISELGLSDDVADLQKRVVATTPRGTVVLQIDVSDTDPDRAAATANAIGDQFAELIGTIGPRDSTGTNLLTVSTIQTAVPPVDPSHPRTARDSALGAVVGLAAGATLVLLLSRRDDRVTSPAVLARTVAAPLVGSVPRPRSETGARAADTPLEHAYHRLEEAIGGLLRTDGPTVLMVTAPTPDCGSSPLTHHLAAALGRNGRRVLLVDTQIRRPGHERPKAETTGPGLAELLAGRRSATEVVVAHASAGYDQVGAGGEAAGPGAAPARQVRPAGTAPSRRTLSSAALRTAVADLAESYDVVLLDTGPVLTVVDPVVVGELADATVLVASTELTQRDDLSRAVQILGLAGIETSGVVLAGGRRPAETEPARVAAGLAPVSSPG